MSAFPTPPLAPCTRCQKLMYSDISSRPPSKEMCRRAEGGQAKLLRKFPSVGAMCCVSIRLCMCILMLSSCVCVCCFTDFIRFGILFGQRHAKNLRKGYLEWIIMRRTSNRSQAQHPRIHIFKPAKTYHENHQNWSACALSLSLFLAMRSAIPEHPALYTAINSGRLHYARRLRLSR